MAPYFELVYPDENHPEYASVEDMLPDNLDAEAHDRLVEAIEDSRRLLGRSGDVRSEVSLRRALKIRLLENLLRSATKTVERLSCDAIAEPL